MLHLICQNHDYVLSVLMRSLRVTESILLVSNRIVQASDIWRLASDSVIDAESKNVALECFQLVALRPDVLVELTIIPVTSLVWRSSFSLSCRLLIEP